MTVDFNDYFWGEKNNGFDVLYHNMKFGLVASKELSEFFREKSNIEEQNSKLMAKLAHKASTGTLNSTFAPVWTILRTSAEKLSTLHLQMVQKLSELVKDVAKYADELHKKHKSVKEGESQTLECVQSMQSSTAAMHKARDAYSHKALELEKLRKENASQKDIDKIETKLKKLQEEYKALLDKHNPIKNDFERRMTQTCKHFQEIEEVHLRQMKEFLSTYLELLQNNHDMVGQVHSDFKRQFLDMSVDKLLEQFVLNKYTGLEKPEISELDFIPLSIQHLQQQSTSASRLNQTTTSISSATNSNSATSIPAITVRTGASLDNHAAAGAEATSIGSGSLGSGTLNAIDDGSPTVATAIKSRPTSPESVGIATNNIANSTPATISTSTSTVRSNIRNWFSSSIPAPTISSSLSKNNAVSVLNASITSNQRSASGNFGMDSNGSGLNIKTFNSELQSLQDNNIQGSFMSSALTQISEQKTTNIACSSTNTTSSSTTSSLPISGILRSRREKTKVKKTKKKKDSDHAENIQEERLTSDDKISNTHSFNLEDSKSKTQNSSGSSSVGGGITASVSSAPGNVETAAVALGVATSSGGASFSANEVDEDGFSIQPQKETAWEATNEKAGSFYTDSDSDSDNDKPDRKIHVKIKPLNNGQAPMSASVDELRATVESISLSPTGLFSHSQQLQHHSRVASRQQSPEISNASTPTATVHPYAPLQSPTLSMSNTSRYAELGDIFSEIGDISASAPASATIIKANSRQIPTPTSSTIAIPRPPSRRSEIAPGRGRISPSSMNRADSISSLEFRTAVGGIGSSRGPSPLTIGISDTIPLAVAFHEIIHAYFRGSDESRCQVKISGDMMLSFPAGIAGLLANNPNPSKLGFRIKNLQNLENVLPNSKIVQIDKNQSSTFSTMLEFNMPALTAFLRRQAEHNPTASYFNVDILKYQVRTKPGASSCPFQLVSYWKCEPTFTALKIDYKYNNHAMTSASPLLNVTISVPVNGSVRNVQSKPHSAWLGESNRLLWNFTDISQNSQDGGVGTLRARLELNDGPSTPAMLTTQFNCEGTTLSGIEFELKGGGYRLSLVKRRFVSGKYVCEGDGIRSAATPTPPSVDSSSPFSAKSN